jgi:hypothetical protein
MELFTREYRFIMYINLAEALLWAFLLVNIGWLLFRFSSLVKYCRNPDAAGSDAALVLPLFKRLGIGLLGMALVKVIQIVYTVNKSNAF